MFETVEGQTMENGEMSYIDFFEQRLEDSEYDEENIYQGMIIGNDGEYGVRVDISRAEETEVISFSLSGDVPLDKAIEYAERMDRDGFYSASFNDKSDNEPLVISKLTLDTREEDRIAIPWITSGSERYDEGIENLKTILNGAGVKYDENSYWEKVDRAVNNIDSDEGMEQFFKNLPPISLEEGVDLETLADTYQAIEEKGFDPQIKISTENLQFEFRGGLIRLGTGNSDDIRSEAKRLEENLGFSREGEYNLQFRKKHW